MLMNSLTIPNSTPLRGSGRKVGIIDNGEESILAQLEEYSFGKEGEVGITCSESNFRRITCSELAARLKERVWNNPERKFVAAYPLRNGEGQQDERGQNLVDTYFTWLGEVKANNMPIHTNTPTGTKMACVSTSEIPKKKIKEFQENYKEVLSTMSSSEIYLYSSTESSIEFLTQTSVVSLINGEDSYTSIVDINPVFFSNLKEGSSGKIDISMKYSKGGEVFNKHTSFEGFRCIGSSENLKISFSDFVEEIDSNLTLEYVNGVVRLHPGNDIDECIIYCCTVTYGDLG